MKKKKYLALLMIAAIIVSMLSGCVGGNGNSDSKTTAADSSAKGGSENGDAAGDVKYRDTITFAYGSDQNYMDGQMNNSNDVLLRACYSQLVRRKPDNDFEGDLAESWEVSEDGCTWTFHLRKGVLFHSGKELTAADVKASYDRLLDTENPVRYNSLATGYISACNVVDDYTVELVTPSPIASMLANLCHRSNLILNSDYIEQYGTELGLTADSVDGTGPYRLTSWDPGQQMALERFDDYYRGPVPTKNVNILIVADASARLVALETGEVDVTIVGASDVDSVKANDDLQVVTFEGIGSYGLQFNCANEYLSNPKLRQAVSYAIDRQAIVDTLLQNVAKSVSTAPVNSNVWGHADLGAIQQDQEKAKQLMAEAGYPDGFEFSIMVYTGYNKSLESCEMIVSDLAKVGITATIETVDNATFSSYQGGRSTPGENFPWGMFYMGFGAGTADCDEGLRRIWATSPDGNNNNNYGWYSNEKVDELLMAAASEMDEQKRLDLYKEAEQILFIDDPAAVWIYDSYLVWSLNKKVEGFKLNVNTVIFWDELRVAE